MNSTVTTLEIIAIMLEIIAIIVWITFRLYYLKIIEAVFRNYRNTVENPLHSPVSHVNE